MAKKVTKKEHGLGIRALLGNQAASKKPRTPKEKKELVKELSNTVAMIPVSKIEPNRDQPRKDFDDAALQELSQSLSVHGLIQPVTVRSMGDGTFQLISGERRWRASQIAKLTEIPAYIRIADDQQMMEMALVENIQREDLNPVEMATSLARLKEEFDLSDDKVAERVGKRRSTISNYLRLLDLPPNMMEELRNGGISMGHARCLVGVKDPMHRQDFFTKLIEQKLSVRDLEGLIQKFNEQKAPQKLKKSSGSGLPTEYETVQNSLRQRFGSKKVAIKLKKDGKGQIILPFSSTDELNRFLDLMED